jgi:hypothetical protein
MIKTEKQGSMGGSPNPVYDFADAFAFAAGFQRSALQGGGGA